MLYFVFQCFIFLDDAQGVADILEKLIKDNEVSGIDHYYCTDKWITKCERWIGQHTQAWRNEKNLSPWQELNPLVWCSIHWAMRTHLEQGHWWVKWPCSPHALNPQWIKHPPCVHLEVMDLIPVGDSVFFFVLRSCHGDQSHFSIENTCLFFSVWVVIPNDILYMYCTVRSTLLCPGILTKDCHHFHRLEIGDIPVEHICCMYMGLL